jgi:hypothetical protein
MLNGNGEDDYNQERINQIIDPTIAVTPPQIQIKEENQKNIKIYNNNYVLFEEQKERELIGTLTDMEMEEIEEEEDEEENEDNYELKDSSQKINLKEEKK